MATLDRPIGPEPIIDEWSAALTAFAWEAVVHLAQSLCAAAGTDAAGRTLVPASIAAARGVLLISPWRGTGSPGDSHDDDSGKP